MMRTACLMTLMLLVVTSPAGAAEIPWAPGLRGGGGQLLIDHQRHPFGGLASDTLFTDFPGGPAVWQRVADDFQLGFAATVQRVVWWGFYGGTFDPQVDPPMGDETMRIRFYDARPADGLPGAVLFEEAFLNPPRSPTGQVIPTGFVPPEFVYEVDLTSSFQLVPA